MPDPIRTPTPRPALADLERRDAFVARHIGFCGDDERAMLATLGFASRAALIDAIVPSAIRARAPLALPAPVPEHEALARLSAIAARNRVLRSFIGQGVRSVAQGVRDEIR